MKVKNIKKVRQTIEEIEKLNNFISEYNQPFRIDPARAGNTLVVGPIANPVKLYSDDSKKIKEFVKDIHTLVIDEAKQKVKKLEDSLEDL